MTELGYILGKDHWGNGYVVEAGRALMAHAFASTNIERIFYSMLRGEL